jgi:hypothetical protein
MRKGVITMDNRINSISSFQYKPIPAFKEIEKFDNGGLSDTQEGKKTKFKSRENERLNFLLGANNGVIDTVEMSSILHDPEKKTEFLEAIVVEVDRLEKDGNEIAANELKAVYFDIVTGKTEEKVMADLPKVARLISGFIQEPRTIYNLPDETLFHKMPRNK